MTKNGNIRVSVKIIDCTLIGSYGSSLCKNSRLEASSGEFSLYLFIIFVGVKFIGLYLQLNYHFVLCHPYSSRWF